MWKIQRRQWLSRRILPHNLTSAYLLILHADQPQTRCNWPAGHHLGTETELMQKYNVSPAVFREAVRPLERLGLLEMRRGRDFGLKTSVPDPISVETQIEHIRNVYQHIASTTENRIFALHLRILIEALLDNSFAYKQRRVESE